MKCPKCGFVSYAGLERCKQCGYFFAKAAPTRSSSPLTSLFPRGVRVPSLKPEPLAARPENPLGPEAEIPAQQAPILENAGLPTSPSDEDLKTIELPQESEEPLSWREELSERVETFRKRRARFQPDTDAPATLELDFEHRDPSQGFGHLDSDEPESPGDPHSEFDLEIGEFVAGRPGDKDSPEPLSFEESQVEPVQLDADSADLDGTSPHDPLGQSAPMEITVDSPEVSAPETEGSADRIYLATVGRRFLAGLADALVLTLGAAVFGIIFWRFCGRLSLIPLNITVLGVIAVLLIFAYFAVFTAVASATPGLLWLRCEIRNFSGGNPTLHESLWRAFGVLVSLSALMLGFVWACVDSDGLTWHDRISGTAIICDYNPPDLAAVNADA